MFKGEYSVSGKRVLQVQHNIEPKNHRRFISVSNMRPFCRGQFFAQCRNYCKYREHKQSSAIIGFLSVKSSFTFTTNGSKWDAPYSTRFWPIMTRDIMSYLSTKSHIHQNAILEFFESLLFTISAIDQLFGQLFGIRTRHLGWILEAGR